MITEGSAQLPMLVTDDNIGNRMLVGPDLASAPIVYSANELNQYTEIAGGTIVNPLHDLDGNITNNGVFAFVWDAENRLTSVSSNGNVIASFKYDYMSRRYEKTDGTVTHSFIYDGWNLLAEHSATPTPPYSVTSFYIWGLDLSGSLQGAGGIGGLVSVTTCNLEPVTCYPVCDANGNITDYVDANGTVVAHKEFDAYGNTIAKAGSMADDFNLWFSSKYWDVETGLGYWGYRYYHPEEGRWLARDPLGDVAFMVVSLSADEASGVATDSELANLYRFVENDPVEKWDYQGLISIGSILRAFFWPWDIGEGLWVMGERDSYTAIVRGWAPVQGNVARLKQTVASNPQDWKQNHITSPGWVPTMSYAPDPKSGWNVREGSPDGTDPDTARRNFIIYVMTGYATDALHTSAIGSFRVIATADEVDVSGCRVKLNVWMYNEMSRRSFGDSANHPLFRWRPMRSQFMWWNWKEEFGFDAQGSVTPLPGSGGGW